MKSMLTWCCWIASSSVLYAADGLEAYRLGNYREAAEGLAKSGSEKGVADYYLGMMRLYGYGTLKNDTIALRHFTKAASQGYLPAIKLLASYYLIHDKNPKLALDWFKKAAALKDTSAQMYMAAAYLFGYGANKNKDSARQYYIEAARAGNVVAQYTLAKSFLDSKDGGNRKMGLIWLGKAADNGSKEAQYELGLRYAEGKSTAKDKEKAEQYLQLAAEKDYTPAIVALADFNRKRGDAEGARRLLTKAAEANKVEAQFLLAKLLLDPESNVFNRESGFLWLLKAAQNGSHEAQLALASAYKDGKFVKADQNLADQWLKAAQNNKEALAAEPPPEVSVARWLSNGQSDSLDFGAYQLGGIYTAWKNKNCMQDNTYNAAPVRKTLSRQILYKPAYVLTKTTSIPVSEYFDILAPKINQTASEEWVFPRYPLDIQIEAVLRDNVWVIRHDRNAPLVDRGTPFKTPRGLGRAFDYFASKEKGWEYRANLQAVLSELYGQAILGESTAQFELGQLYQYGIGVAKDIPQAISYFELAAAQQDARAEYNLGVLYLEGQTTPIDYKKGVAWMTDAAFKGNPYAQFALANLYDRGLKDPSGNTVISSDHQQALAMYYLASSNNYGDAQYRLADYLVKEKHPELGVEALEARRALIKRLYQDAVNSGVADAVVPLAYYYAMDADPKKRDQAFNIANEEARKGNKEAALLLGLLFERGIAVPENQVAALYWYQQAGLDNPVTAFILGSYYLEGRGVPQNVAKGRELLQQAANNGFGYALLNLAVLKQRSGEPFVQDLDKARQLGNASAGLLLADTYLASADNPDAMKQASDIYRYFAEKGDKLAQTKLGYLYDQGLALAANPELAQSWYTRAAEQGQPIAQYLLAQWYQMGRQQKEPDYQEAKKWYRAAAKHYPPAATALGFLYDTVDNDYASAQKSYEKADQANNANGRYNLGLLYEYGKGMPIDSAKAMALYVKAAEAGQVKAMTQLAGLYFKNANVDHEGGRGIYWYKKAANLGDSEAMYQLGLLAETGAGVPLNYKEAISYYQKASAAGNEKAKIALARMYQYGLGVPKNASLAIDTYKQLAANNNAYAQFQLANMALNGLLGEDGKARALQWLQQASDNGNKEAAVLLQRLKAEQEPQLSFIQPVVASKKPLTVHEQTAELLYRHALAVWNRGDEALSRKLLSVIVKEYPSFAPAKKAYLQLHPGVGQVTALK